MGDVWRHVPISDLATFCSGGTPNKGRPDYWNGPVPWVTVKDMKVMRLNGVGESLTDEGAKTVRVVPPGSVLIVVRGMGLFKRLPVVLCDRPVTFNQDVKGLIPNDGVDGEFLALSIVARQADILRHVDIAGHGTGRLDTELLKSTPLPVPPLPQQRKIAEILRTWDEAIEKLTALRAAKELKYRAFARKFFEPCHLSFHGRPNIWQEFELDAIFTERSQAGVDGERLLSVTMNGGVIDRDDVGRKDTSTDDKSRYKLVLPGDIAYNTMRMWQGVSGLSTIQGIVSPAYTVVTPLEARILGRYAAHLFKSRRMVFDFERYSQGLTSDTWNLKFPAFSKIKVWLPPVDDQEKQADLLDAMLVESRRGAVAWALWASLRFLSPLIKPDVRISRIRLPDRLHLKAHGGGPRWTRLCRITPSSPNATVSGKRLVPRDDTLWPVPPSP